jgi:hypothetical protein
MGIYTCSQLQTFLAQYSRYRELKCLVHILIFCQVTLF